MLPYLIAGGVILVLLAIAGTVVYIVNAFVNKYKDKAR